MYPTPQNATPAQILSSGKYIDTSIEIKTDLFKFKDKYGKE